MDTQWNEHPPDSFFACADSDQVREVQRDAEASIVPSPLSIVKMKLEAQGYHTGMLWRALVKLSFKTLRNFQALRKTLIKD